MILNCKTYIDGRGWIYNFQLETERKLGLEKERRSILTQEERFKEDLEKFFPKKVDRSGERIKIISKTMTMKEIRDDNWSDKY